MWGRGQARGTRAPPPSHLLCDGLSGELVHPHLAQLDEVRLADEDGARGGRRGEVYPIGGARDYQVEVAPACQLLLGRVGRLAAARRLLARVAQLRLDAVLGGLEVDAHESSEAATVAQPHVPQPVERLTGGQEREGEGGAGCPQPAPCARPPTWRYSAVGFLSSSTASAARSSRPTTPSGPPTSA